MNHEIEAAEGFVAAVGDVLDLRVVSDVERKDEGIGKICSQLAHVLFETIALIRDGEPRAGVGNSLGDCPRDRPFVGDADDQTMRAG